MNRSNLRAHNHFDEPLSYKKQVEIMPYMYVGQKQENGTYKVLFSWRKVGILMYTEASVRGFLTSYIYSGVGCLLRRQFILRGVGNGRAKINSSFPSWR